MRVSNPMSDSTYTKREQDHFYSDVRERLEKQDVMLQKILEQATKTNGRVNKLEDWKGFMVWGFGILTTICFFVINKLWD